MKKYFVGYSVIFLFIILYGFCELAGAAEPLAAGTVCGSVTGPDGTPVAGASVFLDNYDYEVGNYRPIVKTTSGRDGSFRLGPLKPGFRDDRNVREMDLRIVAAGFAPQTIPNGTVSIFSGMDFNLGKIRLNRGQILSGQVLDYDGHPRPGAAVECQARRYRTSGFGSPLTPIYKLMTDAQGRFVTPPLPVSFAEFTVRVSQRQMPCLRLPIGPDGRVEMEPIHLRLGNPITGIVSDDKGMPIVGAKVYASGWDFGPAWLLNEQLLTDSHGRFVLEGLGRKVQLLINATDYVGIDWVLRGASDGIRWHEVRGWDGDAHKLSGPTNELRITMASLSWIEGRAIDGETGHAVHLNRIVRCTFDRNPAGEIVLNGCQSPEFSQDADGVFRVPYSFPDEYHLTVSAAGYEDAEAFTPPVKELRPVTGIVVKMHKLKDSTPPQVARQTISGTVRRDGQLVKTGWVALCFPSQQINKVNAEICRGRTVTSKCAVCTSAPICNGTYSIDVPFQRADWVVEEEDPGQPITQLVNVSVSLSEHKKLDITAVHGGSIRGRVEGIPMPWVNDTWIVAFTRSGLRFQVPVDSDGRFCFPLLPPGKYGLKAGYDAFLDAECPPQVLPDDDPAYSSPAEPWKQGKIVDVEPDRITSNIRLTLPRN